eukprot:gene1278-1619_t
MESELNIDRLRRSTRQVKRSSLLVGCIVYGGTKKRRDEQDEHQCLSEGDNADEQHSDWSSDGLQQEQTLEQQEMDEGHVQEDGAEDAQHDEQRDVAAGDLREHELEQLVDLLQGKSRPKTNQKYTRNQNILL